MGMVIYGVLGYSALGGDGGGEMIWEGSCTGEMWYWGVGKGYNLMAPHGFLGRYIWRDLELTVELKQI